MGGSHFSKLFNVVLSYVRISWATPIHTGKRRQEQATGQTRQKSWPFNLLRSRRFITKLIIFLHMGSLNIDIWIRKISLLSKILHFNEFLALDVQFLRRPGVAQHTLSNKIMSFYVLEARSAYTRLDRIVLAALVGLLLRSVQQLWVSLATLFMDQAGFYVNLNVMALIFVGVLTLFLPLWPGFHDSFSRFLLFLTWHLNLWLTPRVLIKILNIIFHYVWLIL